MTLARRDWASWAGVGSPGICEEMARDKQAVPASPALLQGWAFGGTWQTSLKEASVGFRPSRFLAGGPFGYCTAFLDQHDCGATCFEGPLPLGDKASLGGSLNVQHPGFISMA